jgi:hypothetical protein
MRKRFLLTSVVLCGLTVSGCLLLQVDTVSDYQPPSPRAEDGLTDDRLEDKPAPPFDPAVVDRRPLDKWQLNASAAVLKLDVPLLKPDVDAPLLTLYPSYADVVAAGRGQGIEILPSVNLIDGKAKQFDDGLYAALDSAYYRGLKDQLHGHVDLVRRFYERAGKDSPASAYLAAGLQLAGVSVPVADPGAKATWLKAFEKNEVHSKPIGFYTWNKELATCFRFLRFFQQEFSPDDLAVPRALAQVMRQDPALQADYEKMLAFYARLTNPLICRSLLDLGAPAGPTHRATVAFLPSSTSRETVLFEKLFPMGLPADADLMNELVKAIRSGKVNLQPNAESGWYEHQAFALETLLLAGRGPESAKLLLTKQYKERMLEAFKALITKRRETHVRQLAQSSLAGCAAPSFLPPPKPKVQPRLRVEPAPTYYLRTARAYSFLANFLEASVGADALRTLHGLRQGGEREPDLRTELQQMRDLFYGLYLISAEDIGMKPALARDELVDADQCYRVAAEWLPRAFGDRDLTADTRVSIPIATDPYRGVTRLWATLGVRLAKLDVEYVRPPHLRAATGGQVGGGGSGRSAAGSLRDRGGRVCRGGVARSAHVDARGVPSHLRSREDKGGHHCPVALAVAGYARDRPGSFPSTATIARLNQISCPPPVAGERACPRGGRYCRPRPKLAACHRD